MAEINSEIENLKKDIDKTQRDMEDLYLELGEVAGQWHKSIAYQPSNDAYAEICRISQAKSEIESQIDALCGALKGVYHSDQQIAKSQLSMKDLDNHYNILVASFGSVAMEVQNEGRLPENLYKCLAPVTDYEKTLASLENKRASYGDNSSSWGARRIDDKIAKHRATLNDIYYEAGKRLINTGDYKMVPGKKALQLIQEMEEVKVLKKNYRGLIKESEETISKAQGELKNMGAYGDNNKALNILEEKDKQLLGQLEVKLMEYGQILASGMKEWMSPGVPADIKEVCRKLRTASKIMMQQNLHMEFLMLDRDIEIHMSQTSAYTTQIENLEQKRQEVDKMIEDMYLKIEGEKSAIKDLRQKQVQISRQVDDLAI